MGQLENSINDLVTDVLREESLEDFLEKFDITPSECVEFLYKAGLIDLDQILDYQ